MFCLNMLAMAMELAREDPAYEDVASKFFEHFVYIAQAMNDMGGEGIGLWDEETDFYYDVLHLGGRRSRADEGALDGGADSAFRRRNLRAARIWSGCPAFARRMQWFLDHHPDVARARGHERADGEWRAAAALRSRIAQKLERIYRYVLDENEFLSPHGIRALSKFHQDASLQCATWMDAIHAVDYEPAESTTDLFGGNSNWRGPVWFPLNFLLIESLQRVHYYYGDEFKVEYPTGSGQQKTLWEAGEQLSQRLSHIFLRRDGRRPVYGDTALFQNDPYWRDLILFYEYFHGDTGAGLGASHQTGWTALVAKLLEQSGE